MEPRAAGAGTGRRVMSLRDGRSKMSKSDLSDQSRINLDDSPDAITQKLRRAKTDAEATLTYDPDRRPEVSNLLEIYAGLAMGGTASGADAAAQLGPAMPMSQFKRELADVVVARVEPIRRELERLRQDPAFLDGVLREGAARARSRAQPKLQAVYRALGLTA